MLDRRLAILGVGLTVAGVVLMTLGAALGSRPISPDGQAGPWGFGPGGMMGIGAPNARSAPEPGSAGFVTGTISALRVVRILATPDLRFTPDTVRVQTGETITFEVTTVGPTTHEFMVGPAADVAADKEGSPEVTDIGMMQTKSLTYRFTGPGPFAFACHAPGHHEAGMTGTIAVVP